MMNLVTPGVSALVGVASGYATNNLNDPTKPIFGNPADPNGLHVFPDSAIETAALVAGAAMQWFMPFTAPSVADGLLNGGAALLGRRAGQKVFKKTAAGMAAPWAGMPMLGGAYAAPSYANGAARGQIGSVSGVPRRHI